MAEHPVPGAKALRKMDSGSGYPRIPARGSLHPVSYMTQIADVNDARRTLRSYRIRLDIKTTLSTMDKGRGTEFDPGLYDNFLRTVLADQAGAEA